MKIINFIIAINADMSAGAIISPLSVSFVDTAKRCVSAFSIKATAATDSIATMNQELLRKFLDNAIPSDIDTTSSFYHNIISNADPSTVPFENAIITSTFCVSFDDGDKSPSLVQELLRNTTPTIVPEDDANEYCVYDYFVPDNNGNSNGSSLQQLFRNTTPDGTIEPKAVPFQDTFTIFLEIQSAFLSDTYNTFLESKSEAFHLWCKLVDVFSNDVIVQIQTQARRVLQERDNFLPYRNPILSNHLSEIKSSVGHWRKRVVEIANTGTTLLFEEVSPILYAIVSDCRSTVQWKAKYWGTRFLDTSIHVKDFLQDSVPFLKPREGPENPVEDPATAIGSWDTILTQLRLAFRIGVL